jgi:hypothetical protein
MAAVEKRLREELAELQVEINEEKSRIVDLGRGESFGFLGFDFRQVRSLRGVWRAHYTPKLKKRTALLRKVKDMFGRNQSQPVGRVVKLINPVLRGRVNYFAVGHSSECFSFVKDWVEKKIKRHMQRARNRQGFGWKRRRGSFGRPFGPAFRAKALQQFPASRLPRRRGRRDRTVAPRSRMALAFRRRLTSPARVRGMV